MNNAFVRGFVKQAASIGLAEVFALKLLKRGADDLTNLSPAQTQSRATNWFPNLVHSVGNNKVFQGTSGQMGGATTLNKHPFLRQYPNNSVVVMSHGSPGINGQHQFWTDPAKIPKAAYNGNDPLGGYTNVTEPEMARMTNPNAHNVMLESCNGMGSMTPETLHKAYPQATNIVMVPPRFLGTLNNNYAHPKINPNLAVETAMNGYETALHNTNKMQHGRPAELGSDGRIAPDYHAKMLPSFTDFQTAYSDELKKPLLHAPQNQYLLENGKWIPKGVYSAGNLEQSGQETTNFPGFRLAGEELRNVYNKLIQRTSSFANSLNGNSIDLNLRYPVPSVSADAPGNMLANPK